MKLKLPRVDEFDGLRGLLAGWVAISHVLCWSGFSDAILPPPLNRWWPDFISAQPAVEIFIILSGFAISFMLHAREQSYRSFMQGRFLRIYPTYLTCLAFGLGAIYLAPTIPNQASWRDTTYFRVLGPLSDHERTHTFTHVLTHLTLLNGLIPHRVLPDAAGTLLPPAWSITLEWQYYLVAPFIARFVYSGTRLLCLGAVACVGLRFGYYWQNPQLAFLPAQLPFFLVGIASYHLYANFVSSGCGRLEKFTVPVAALLLVVVITAWHSMALGAWTLAFGCVFVDGGGLFARALRVVRGVLLHPWLQKVGSISYPLYLIHWPIIVLWLYLLLRWKPTLTSAKASLWLFVLAIPSSLLAAGVLHRFVEVPLMKIGRVVRVPSENPPPVQAPS